MDKLILVQISPNPPADWVLFLGHFHPLIVHLPIGFLLIAGLLELDRLTRRNTVSQHTIALILFWSAVSATMACVFGYMLSLGGGYEVDTLNAHKWQGIGVALFAWLAWLVKVGKVNRRIPLAQRLYLPSLSVAVVLLLSAGHQGGNLTHGSDYLTQYVPTPFRALAGLSPKAPTVKIEPITDVKQALVYQQIVNPILQTRCIQCHNADKAKAGLRLDTPDRLKKGSEDGPVFIAGKSSRSELVKACLLPEDDDHHMPPKGKPQLTADQITLLSWWIDQGASFDNKVADLTVNDAVRPVLASLGKGNGSVESGGTGVAATSPAPESPVLTIKVAPASPAIIAELKKTGLMVSPVSNEQNQLQISAVNTRTFDDTQAALLPKLSDQIVWLQLGQTALSDAGLAHIGKLKNLQKLHLEQTKVTDAGLKQLRGLPYLEYLNLYGTAVTDAGLNELASLKSLRTVYVWQTSVTPQGLATLRKRKPSLAVIGAADQEVTAEPKRESLAKAGIINPKIATTLDK